MLKSSFTASVLLLFATLTQPVFAEFDDAIPTCGLTGTLQQRIASCDSVFHEKAQRAIPVNDPLEPNAVFRWYLVTRTVNRAQVWYDSTSRLVWSDISPTDRTLEDSISYCMGDKLGLEYKGENQLSLTGKNRLSFILPTQTQYRQAITHGALDVLPNWRDQGMFWTSTSSQSFTFCSSEYHPGYYTGNPGSINYTLGFYSYACAPDGLIAVLEIERSRATWDQRTTMFGHIGAFKCVARADEP